MSILTMNVNDFTILPRIILSVALMVRRFVRIVAPHPVTARRYLMYLEVRSHERVYNLLQNSEKADLSDAIGDITTHVLAPRTSKGRGLTSGPEKLR